MLSRGSKSLSHRGFSFVEDYKYILICKCEPDAKREEILSYQLHCEHGFKSIRDSKVRIRERLRDLYTRKKICAITIIGKPIPIAFILFLKLIALVAKISPIKGTKLKVAVINSGVIITSTPAYPISFKFAKLDSGIIIFTIGSATFRNQ